MKSVGSFARVGVAPTDAPARSDRSTRTDDRLACAAIVVFAIATLVLARTLNVWTDELYTLNSTAFGPARAFESALGFEQQPPLYFVLVALLREISPSDFFARCISIACAILTLVTLFFFAKRHLRAVSPAVVVACVAINPFFIWSALEIRTYALVVLEAAIVVATFFEGFLGERIDRRAIYAFAVVSILGIYTQYYVGSLVAGCGIALLLLRRDRFVPYLLAIVPFLILCLPAAKIALWQAGQIDHTAVHMLGNLKSFGVTFVTFVFPRDWAAFKYGVGIVPKAGYTIFALLCLWPIVASIVRGRVSFEAKVLAILAFAVASFLLLLVLARLEMYFPRHMTVLFVPLALAMFALIGPIAERDRAFAGNVAAGYVVLAIASLVFVYRPLAKDGDWIRVGAFLDANAGPNDVIDIFDPEMELGVSHYYRGPAHLEPIPIPPMLDRWDLGPYEFASPTAVGVAMDRVRPTAPGRRWLVIDPYPCPDSETVVGCKSVLRYVSGAYRIALERRFYLTGVLLLEERPRVDTSSARTKRTRARSAGGPPSARRPARRQATAPTTVESVTIAGAGRTRAERMNGSSSTR